MIITSNKEYLLTKWTTWVSCALTMPIAHETAKTKDANLNMSERDTMGDTKGAEEVALYCLSFITCEIFRYRQSHMRMKISFISGERREESSK